MQGAPPGYPPQGYPQQPPGYPPQGYGYPPQQPPPKKGKGCLIAGLIVGGVVLVIGVVVVVLVVMGLRKVGQVASEGLSAPGTKELGAMGCDVPMVMDVGKIGGMMGIDAAPPPGDNAGLIVSCTVNAGKTPPSCDDVAKTYVKAVTSPSGKFIAQVQVQGRNKPECQKMYSETGAFIKTVTQ